MTKYNSSLSFVHSPPALSTYLSDLHVAEHTENASIILCYVLEVENEQLIRNMESLINKDFYNHITSCLHQSLQVAIENQWDEKAREILKCGFFCLSNMLLSPE